MRTRLLLAAVLAASLLSVPSSALAGTRSMTVKVPKTILTNLPFAASFSGDTGPGDSALGGFIIYARLVKGKVCPANAAIPKKTTMITIAGGNLFGAGAFSSGDRPVAYTAGKYTVCGYITQNNENIVFDLVYQSKHQVTVKKRSGFHIAKTQKVKDGIYSATTATTVGGNPDASVTFTVAGGNVVSASATGIPTVSCFGGFTTQTPVTTALSSTTPSGGSPNKAYNSFNASFDVTPNQFSISGGATSDKTFMGAVAATSSDGSCTGTFAFTATRAK